jgi:hypothetical protein
MLGVSHTAFECAQKFLKNNPKQSTISSFFPVAWRYEYLYYNLSSVVENSRLAPWAGGKSFQAFP